MIDSSDHDIVSVQVESNETSFESIHENHLHELLKGSQTCRLGQESNRHQYELVAQANIRAGHPNGQVRAYEMYPSRSHGLTRRHTSQDVPAQLAVKARITHHRRAAYQRACFVLLYMVTGIARSLGARSGYRKMAYIM